MFTYKLICLRFLLGKLKVTSFTSLIVFRVTVGQITLLKPYRTVVGQCGG